MAQARITDFIVDVFSTPSVESSMEREVLVRDRYDTPYSSRSSLSLSDAQELALRAVRRLPSGTKFTLKGLFPELRVRGDQRRRAAILQPLRRLGMIESAGITREDQENRNAGYATLWCVRPREVWEDG